MVIVSPHLLPRKQDQQTDQVPSFPQSGPTNFRREDISMPGLSPQQQQEIREKARADAEKMWKGLQPLASSPSTQFAERPMPTLEQFVEPRKAPVPGSREDVVNNRNNTNNINNISPGAKQSPNVTVDGETINTQRHSGGHNWSNSIRVHSRKISDALSKPLGYDKGTRTSRDGSPYEMRALIDPSRTAVGGAPQGKMSADSFSVDDSEGEAVIGERDSAKALRRGPAVTKI